MSAIKPIIREVKQSVLKGFAHAKDKLHQLADNLTKHVDDVVKKVKGQDHFDAPPALTGSVTNRVDRTTTELLYRADDRSPAVIFAEGFQVRDSSNNDLSTFVHTNGPSNFVSTSRDPNLYQRWGSEYRYTVDSPGGIDVDASMPDGPYAPHTPAPEFEIAFQGGIDAEHVVGAHPVLSDGTLGSWIPNPTYSGGR